MGARRLAWAILAALACATLFATAVRLFMPPQWGAGVGWTRTLLYNLGHFAIWAALGPAIVWGARRLPLARRGWRVTIPAQLVASCLVAIAQLALAELVLAAVLPGDDPVRPSLVDAIRFTLAVNFQSAVMTYWAIAGLAYAYFFHTREVAAAEAQLRTVESHVAPHFLFNALNSVTALVDLDPDAAKRLLARIGDLLRRSLAARDTPTLTLEEELEVVGDYLAIEQIRFADRLATAIDADPGARRCRIPAFLLQPLVENAIRHGLQPSLEPVTVRVTARRDGALLHLEIADDATTRTDARPDGLGLTRTKARLAQAYGTDHALSAGVHPGGGYRVRIELPATEVAP
jgi:hypothetical protein